MIPKGFTLLEILIVMGILVLVFAVGAPVSLGQLYRSSTDSEARQLASTLYAVQQKAFTGLQDSDYGVRIETDKYTEFKGISFDAGTEKNVTKFDTRNALSSKSLSGAGSDIIFTKGQLKPNVYGTFTISSTAASYIVEVTSQGFVTYYSL